VAVREMTAQDLQTLRASVYLLALAIWAGLQKWGVSRSGVMMATRRVCTMRKPPCRGGQGGVPSWVRTLMCTIIHLMQGVWSLNVWAGHANQRTDRPSASS